MTAAPLTREEREAAMDRCESATAGPWQTRFWHRIMERVRQSPGNLFFGTKDASDWDDCDFIAHAREDLPRALATIDHLESQVADLKSQVAIQNALISSLEGDES